MSKSYQSNYWTKRISCTIMKFNSRCIINKINEIGHKKAFRDEAFCAEVICEYGSKAGY